MSMLAERKRKQKWSLNPRGKDWAQDANKFGQKMLEKMGWQHGKGLGANEDGITEHIKVSYKNDSKGMGYKETNDQWTEHESNFSALLESLSGTVEKSDEIKVQSLEKKSETSRRRVHYHKFTRGKDLSRYSEKDLANIFGKKSLKEIKKEEVKEEPVTDSNIEKLEKDSKFLVNAGSMRDYFKKKLPNFGKTNGYVVGSNGVLQRGESDSETEARPSFSFNNVQKSDEEETNQYTGFGFKSEVKEDESKQRTTFVSYVNEHSVEESAKKKKKKRKIEEAEVSTPKKKIKEDDTPKKLKCENGGLSNPAFNPLCTPVKVEKHVLDTIEESFSEEMSVIEESVKTVETEVEVHETKKNMTKIKKNGADNNGESVLEVCNGIQTEENEIRDGTPSKKKKKNKSLSGIDNSNFEKISSDISQCADSSVGETQKKKKGKLQVENPDVVSLQVEENSSEIQASEKKKKKKKDKLAVENPAFNVVEEDSVDNSQNHNNLYEVKPKKKKKKEFQTTENLSSIENIASEETPKKRKKKKEAMAVENPCFNVSTEESPSATQVEENPYEVKPKKKRKLLELQNPTSDSSVDNSKSEENSYEIKRKKKKKEKEVKAIENPAFNDVTDSSIDLSQINGNSFEAVEEEESEVKNNAFEVERKKKPKKKKEENGIANPGLDLDTTQENISLNIEESDLMLNIVTTPILSKPQAQNSEATFSITKVNGIKRRKSVRFSDVTQERIIPNNDELRSLTDIETRNELFDINTQVLNSSLNDQDRGLDNLAFDKHRNRLEENLDSMSKKLDRYQAEIENDINEKKMEAFAMDDIMIGEVGNPHGDNEKLEEGTKLKFKYAHFLASKVPRYQLDKVGSKKGYRHLIKGDIVVKFNNTNLHRIEGYAVKNNGAVRS